MVDISPDHTGYTAPASLTTQGGANANATSGMVRPFYAQRDMMIYGITENEKQSISAGNTRSAIFLSVGTSLASFAAACFLSGQFSDPFITSGEALALYHFGTPVLFALSLVFFFLTYLEHRNKNSTIRIIEKESKPYSPPTPQ